MVISIEGCIGSGKSTTARMVADRLKYGIVLEETAKHPFLADFYSHPSLFALETELAFALLHFHQLKEVREEAGLVSDFSLGKDLIFAKMNLAGRDLGLFEHVFNELRGRVVIPNHCVFLDLPVDALLARIRMRGRPYEQGIAPSYIERLRATYFDNLSQLAVRITVLDVAADDAPEVVASKALNALADQGFAQ